MDTPLIVAAALMGLAGAPHCAAMCGSACALMTQCCGGAQRRTLMSSFTIGRWLSYAAGGAAVAAGVGAVSVLSSAAPVLRPLWTLLHLAVLGLGLWLLLTGSQPAWWSRLGGPVMAAPAPGWQRMSAPLRAGAAGGMLLALPCGLLQSALLVAALANTPLQGALAMGSFAATSALGLWLPGMVGPRWWSSRPAMNGVMLRLAGGMLTMASAWALWHDLWSRWVAWCQS